MQTFQSDFHFKGERKYINFATLVETLRKLVTEVYGDVYNQLLIKNFKVHKYITQNSMVKVFDVAELKDAKHKENILAEMQCSIRDKNYFVGVYEDQPSPIEKRIQFPDKELVGPIDMTQPFSGNCELINFKDNHQLVQAFGTALKQLHFLSLPQSDKPYEIKSALMSGYRCPYEVPGNDARLTMRNLGVQENSSHQFTFNQLDLDINGHQTRFQLCYSIKKQ